jgi:hypothetical protein
MKLKITVNSEDQAKFWIRLFQLEAQIEEVRKLMDVPATPRAWASVPVINEFKVDRDLEFAYVLLFTVDALGPQHVIGNVYICDQANREEIIKARDALADEVMTEMKKRHDKIVAEGKGEYHDMLTVIDPGREHGNEPPLRESSGGRLKPGRGKSE